MDNHTLALFIPILALSIPVAGTIFYGLQKVARIKLEEARLRAGGGEARGEVTELRDEVGELRRELTEVQERLDFAERLLSKPREEPR